MIHWQPVNIIQASIPNRIMSSLPSIRNNDPTKIFCLLQPKIKPFSQYLIYPFCILLLFQSCTALNCYKLPLREGNICQVCTQRNETQAILKACRQHQGCEITEVNPGTIQPKNTAIVCHAQTQTLTNKNCIERCCSTRFLPENDQQSDFISLCPSSKESVEEPISFKWEMLAMIAAGGFLCIVLYLLYGLCWKSIRTERDISVAPPQKDISLKNYKIEQEGPLIANCLEVCAVCLDDLTTVRTKCGHYFHPVCLKAWVQKKAVCPVCMNDQLNPLKIYCTKCYSAIQLAKIRQKLSKKEERQFERFVKVTCSDCLGSERVSLIQFDESNQDPTKTARNQHKSTEKKREDRDKS